MPSTQLALLKKYGLQVRGFRGQHLLVDPNIQRKIVELVDPRPREWILEIGPGLGALTGEMLSAGACVIAVEKDRRFCEILEGELGADYRGKLRIENADILKTDLKKLLTHAASLRVPRRSLARHCEPAKVLWRAKQSRWARDRLRNLKAEIASASLGARPRNDRRIKVVSNLPYYITSPVLFWLIANRTRVERAILMMQREVANRLLAQPGDKDYGRLTLGIRFYAEVHRAFDVSRNCFTPRPDVDSSVVTIDFYPPSKLPKDVDEALLFRLIRLAFGKRRKTLLNCLSHDSKTGRSREELAKILGELGIPETARGEELLLKDFLSLAEHFQMDRV